MKPSRLIRKTSLRSRSTLRRTGKPKPFSDKRRKLIPARRECREIVHERDEGRCRVKGPNCTGEGTQVHEILSRARGGDITDPDNCLLVCANCGRDVHLFPAWATKKGFLRSQHGGTQG